MHQSTELGMEPRILCVQGECSASGGPASVLICIIKGLLFFFCRCFVFLQEIGGWEGFRSPFVVGLLYVGVDTSCFLHPRDLVPL